MRSEGESHLSLANTSVQKMIKMTPVTPCSSLVTWSVGEVWAAHGFMRCISSINYWICIFIHKTDGHYPILLSLYYTFEIRWCVYNTIILFASLFKFFHSLKALLFLVLQLPG